MELENREAWLQSILVSAMDAIISIDSRQNIILFNKAAETMFGYTSDEIIDKPLNILLPERYRTQHTEHIRHFSSTGISTRQMGELGTVFGLRSNGEEFPLEASISQFEIEGEKYLTVILRDITKRVQYDKNIAESKKSYQNLFNSLSDAVFVMDTSGTFLNVNQRALDMYDYSQEEFYGTTFTLINAGGKKELDYIEERIQSASRGTIEKFEWKCRTKTGWTIQNDFTLTKGTYFGQDVVIATAHDITKRKQKEEQIKLFENIIKSVNDSITFVSLNGVIEFVNQAFCTTYGYEEEEITGENIGILVSPENPAYLLRYITIETFKNGWNGELQAKRKDGTDIPVYLSTSAVADSEGKPTGFVVVSLDMTKQKQLEGQLIYTHKMESLRMLVEGIAHNFNNILAIIVGYSSLSQHENVSREKINDNLKAVIEAAERGASLVKQLFTFSTKSSERLLTISLNSVLQETVQIVRETFPKDISIFLDLTDSNPLITADQKELRQIFLNVLINAREAMPNGGTITVSTRMIEDNSQLPQNKDYANEKQYVRLSISDTGQGMHKETKERIFDPFFTTKDIGEGIGLGLTIAYGIIERYNGFIDLDSSPGKGTTVHIDLPCEAEPGLMSIDQNDIEPNRPGTRATILIVEDEDAFRKLLARSLEKSGYTVLTAIDGRDALDVYEKYRETIDIVLLDIGLPVISGLTILQKIREGNTDVKIIVMTGYDTSEMISTFDAFAVNEIVQKPFDIDFIIERVENFLND